MAAAIIAVLLAQGEAEAWAAKLREKDEAFFAEASTHVRLELAANVRAMVFEPNAFSAQDCVAISAKVDDVVVLV